MSALTAFAAAWASSPWPRTRVEHRLEQFDERASRLRVFVEHGLDVRLAVRKARLPQIFRVTPEHDHLLPGQALAHDQLVEAVDLDPALPDRRDRLGESLRPDIPFLRRGAGIVASGES